MKFICQKCSSFFAYKGVSELPDNSLSISYRCEKCGFRIAMITNAGETKVLQSTGLQLGSAKSSDKAAAPAAASTAVASAVRWTPEAETRIARVPEMVRETAKSAIERMAVEKGSYLVDEALMDEAKKRFM